MISLATEYDPIQENEGVRLKQFWSTSLIESPKII